MGAVFGLRSWYSRKGGLLSPKEAVAAAKEAGATSIAFCDLHEFGGVHEWLSSAREAGLSAICGIEVLLDWDNAQLPTLFFGRGPEGARRISRLLSKASVNTAEQLIVAPSKDSFSSLIVCTGGASGHFSRLAGRRDIANLERFFFMMGETGARMLIGVDPANDDPYHLETVKRFSKFAAIPYRPLLYRSRAEHALYSDVAGVISDGPAEPWVTDFSICTMESMAERAKAIGGYSFDQRWISVLGKPESSVGEGFLVVENPGELFLGGEKTPRGAFTELMKRCAGSLKTMVSSMEPVQKERYAQRLDLEGDAIEKLNMAGYLLALSEVVATVRTGQYPIGRGRGSSINSLVCRLLDITSIDPVAEDLPFERFLNVNRAEIPDVDLDVSRKAAPLIRSGIKRLFPEAYGLRTFVTPSVRSFLPKIMALRGFKSGTVEAFQRDLKESDAPEAASTWDEVVQSWPQARETLNARCGSAQSADSVLELMDQIGYERPVRSTIHESGIAACAKPFQEIVALQPCRKNNESELCVACPAGTAEKRGIVKLDVLPLDSLDQLGSINRRLAKLGTAPVFSEGGREFGEVHGQATLDRGFTSGIFQFERQGELLAQLSVRSLEDLSFATGLVRVIGPGGTVPEKPGCLSNAPQALKTIYNQVTSKTRGLLVFQEQLMKLLVQAGGMGFEDAEKVRRAIAKKTGEAESYRSQFAQGCAERFDVAPGFGEIFFDEMTRGGKYLFNQGHALSYAQIAAAQIVAKTENTAETFVEISRSMRQQPYRRRHELKDALGRLVYECRSLGLAMEPIDLTASGGVMSSPSGEPVEVSRGIFTHPAVRVGLDLIADLNSHQIREANRKWDKAKGLFPETLKDILRDEQVVNLICLGAWDNSGRSREALLRNFLHTSVPIESHAAYERQCLGYVTDIHHPGLTEGFVPVDRLRWAGFSAPKVAFKVGGFITEVTDVVHTQHRRHLRAALRLTNYMGGRPVELSRFFDSVKEGELWVQRHRSIDPMSPVSLLVEARPGKRGMFFNPVSDAMVSRDKPLDVALSAMRKNKTVQLLAANRQEPVCV
jgi:DNA polymerase III alpha subunit